MKPAVIFICNIAFGWVKVKTAKWTYYLKIMTGNGEFKQKYLIETFKI